MSGPPTRSSARSVIAAVTDGFTELPPPAGSCATGGAGEPVNGPIGWRGYDASRARAREHTGESESVVCGVGRVGETEAVLLAFEFGFLGGSLSERAGDRIEAAFTRARERRLPVVSLIATGGSRMQEGMRALVQLQRVARQAALTRAAGLPQIAVVRDPTTGGGWATLGAGADVILGLSGAQVGFAGARVRPPDADPRAYTAEAQWRAGHLDAVVRPEEVRGALARWLSLLAPSPAPHRQPPEPAPPPAALPAHRPPAPTGTAGDGGGEGVSVVAGSGWEAVLRARSPARPRAEAYLDAYFEAREELSGDRCGGRDTGMRCGFGRHRGRSVGFVAQCGTANRPAGFRTAARLIRLADRLGIPVLTLVDTPGAANDAAAERAGAGPALAEVFAAVAEARVPVTTLVIGEGGSGGALALASADRSWATPDSYFSVIAPELAAAILKRGPDAVRSTADQLRLRPRDLVELGVVRGVVGPEPPGPDDEPVHWR